MMHAVIYKLFYQHTSIAIILLCDFFSQIFYDVFL